MLNLYVASPFFTTEERTNCEKVIEILRRFNFEVYAPMEHEVADAWTMPNDVWASHVFKADVEAIRKSDGLVVIDYGLYSDSGTAWECGFAYALNKPVLHLIVDENKEYSLMMINGTKTGAYNSLEHFFKGDSAFCDEIEQK